MSNLVLNKEAKDAIGLNPGDRTILDNLRGEKLIQLARDHFDPHTTEAELEVLRVSASVVDPPWPKDDTGRAEIRPEFLRWLAADPDAAACIAPKGIRAFYVDITGGLDFYGYRATFPLMFWLSRIQGDVNIQSAETADFVLINSDVGGIIYADRANVKGTLILRDSRISEGIGLNGARIEGALDFSGAELGMKPVTEATSVQAYALSADATEVGTNLWLSTGFHCAGPISLRGAHIKGSLYCSGAHLVAAPVAKDTGASEAQAASLQGALNPAQVIAPAVPDAGKASTIFSLTAEVAKIDGDALFIDGFSSCDGINLAGAQIGGEIQFSNAEVGAEPEEAGKAIAGSGSASRRNGVVIADNAKIDGRVTFTNEFRCSDRISLISAQIGGQLFFRNAVVGTESGRTLEVDAKDGETSQKNAVIADYARIGGSLFFRDGFIAHGGVCLGSAQVGKDLSFFGSRLGKVDCRGLQLSGDFLWLSVKAAESDDEKPQANESKGADSGRADARKTSQLVELDLSDASIGNLNDDTESWPLPGSLTLDGCVYKALILRKSPSPTEILSHKFPNEVVMTAGDRIDWLKRQSPINRRKPQPWLQLGAYLDSKGDHRGAKHVLYRLKRQREPKPEGMQETGTGPQWTPGPWSDLRDIGAALLDIPTCFRHPIRSFLIAFAWLEEMPFRICWSIGLVLLLGSLIFWNAAAHGVLAPTDEKAYEAFDCHADLPGTYPKLNPFIYTLENAVPLAKMGLDEKWAPDPHGGSHDANRSWNSWLTSYGFLMTIRWLLILSGWFQAAVLAAALSGLFKE
jgi:hypothetical protein